jgi:hypothetical protein
MELAETGSDGSQETSEKPRVLHAGVCRPHFSP